MSEQNNRPEMMGRVVQAIQDGQSFLLTGHEFVDGDSTGSEVALYHGLTRMGRDVRIINNDPLMGRYGFLDPDGLCEVYDPAQHDAYIESVDVIIVVDNNSWSRLVRLEDPLKNAAGVKVCIDHHLVSNPFCDLHVYDTGAAATGELIYEVLLALDATIDRPIADALYTAIATDTGWFRFSNTTARTFEICRDLTHAGMEPHVINEAINFNNTPELKALLSVFLRGVAVDLGGALAVGSVTQEMIRGSSVSLIETDEFIEFVRDIRGASVAALFKEQRSGVVKISLRSRGEYSAHVVATAMGGGGHRHASGASHPGPIADAISEVTRLVAQQVDEYSDPEA
jgi:phosphoesterase RecJ-like protein